LCGVHIVGEKLSASFIPEVEMRDDITSITTANCFLQKNDRIRIETSIRSHVKNMFLSFMTYDKQFAARGEDRLDENEVVKVAKFLIPVACFASHSQGTKKDSTLQTVWNAKSVSGDEGEWSVKLSVLKALPPARGEVRDTFTPSARQSVFEQSENKRVSDIKCVVNMLAGNEAAETFEMGRMPCMPGLLGAPMAQRLVSCSDENLKRKLLSAGWNAVADNKLTWGFSSTQMHYVQTAVSVMPECYIPTLKYQEHILAKIGAELCDLFKIERVDNDERLCGALIEHIGTKIQDPDFTDGCHNLLMNMYKMSVPGESRYKPDVRVECCVAENGFTLATALGGELMNFMGRQPLDQRLMQGVYPDFEPTANTSIASQYSISSSVCGLSDNEQLVPSPAEGNATEDIKGDCEDSGSFAMLLQQNVLVLHQLNRDKKIDLASLIAETFNIPKNSHKTTFYVNLIDVLGRKLDTLHIGVPFIAATGASANNHNDSEESEYMNPLDVFKGTCMAMRQDPPTLGGHAANARTILAAFQLPPVVQAEAKKRNIEVFLVRSKFIEGTGCVLEAKQSVQEANVTMKGVVGDSTESLVSEVKKQQDVVMNGARCQTFMSTVMSVHDNQVSKANGLRGEFSPIAIGVQRKFYHGVNSSGDITFATANPSMLGKQQGPRGPGLTAWTSYSLLSNAKLNTNAAADELVSLGIRAGIDQEEQRHLDWFAMNVAPQLIRSCDVTIKTLPMHHLRSYVTDPAKSVLPDTPPLFNSYAPSDTILVLGKGNWTLQSAAVHAQRCNAKGFSLLSRKNLIMHHRNAGGIQIL
jgi:hypothetical protein